MDYFTFSDFLNLLVLSLQINLHVERILIIHLGLFSFSYQPTVIITRLVVNVRGRRLKSDLDSIYLDVCLNIWEVLNERSTQIMHT